MNLTLLENIYGIAFQPYVGPWDAGGPILFNTYTLEQVTQLLTPVAQHFSLVATYGQGTFVWQNNPIVQDSNRLNIQAAKAVGLKVAAGCYQQGADPGNDTINIDWTKAEIDYAIQQAKQFGNVVELIIGNECLWGPNSTQAIIQLINYAKSQRTAAGFTPETLPVTTRQKWDVLAGVSTSGWPLRSAVLQLLNGCEGFVYANMYAYFDPNIAGQIGPNSTQASFTQAVTTSMDNTLTALKSAFASQNLTTEIRIGETGWPTSGSQPGQPNAAIATVQNAQWYVQAMQNWSATNTIKTILFEAYDEPWKAQGNDNSETHFGLWQAVGTSSAQNQYTLTGVQQKVAIAS